MVPQQQRLDTPETPETSTTFFDITWSKVLSFKYNFRNNLCSIILIKPQHYNTVALQQCNSWSSCQAFLTMHHSTVMLLHGHKIYTVFLPERCTVSEVTTCIQSAVFGPWYRHTTVLPPVHWPVDDALFEISPEIHCSGVSSCYCCHGNHTACSEST